MITILSDNELRKATISETKGGFTIAHYRRKSDRNTWVFDHAAFSEWPLHLVLDMAHSVVTQG